MSNLELVSITPNLSNELKIIQIKERIITRLTELKVIDAKFKNNQDVLLLVCNLVEHMVRDKKINKKNVVLDIIQTLYNPTAVERTAIDHSIEFLHSNKAIKRLSKFYLFCVSAYEYFFKSRAKKD